MAGRYQKATRLYGGRLSEQKSLAFHYGKTLLPRKVHRTGKQDGVGKTLS
jgi:hypothetical protein